MLGDSRRCSLLLLEDLSLLGDLDLLRLGDLDLLRLGDLDLDLPRGTYLVLDRLDSVVGDGESYELGMLLLLLLRALLLILPPCSLTCGRGRPGGGERT